MKPRKPLPRSTKPIKRGRVKRVNAQRKAREFARTYHSVERVEFVKRLPCASCGKIGASQNAHIGKEGKGAARKGNYDQIAPLCGPNRWGEIGCHTLHDLYYSTTFRTLFPRFDAPQACAATEAAWQSYTAGA